MQIRGITNHVIILNYRGMMYNGERVISLWKGKKEDKKETDIEDYQMPNPCGPASNNSDPKAVQLHIKFDSYGFPMYFPSCTSPSWSVVLSQQKNTNVAVRRQFSRLLDYIRQGKLHSVSVIKSNGVIHIVQNDLAIDIIYKTIPKM